MNWTHPNFSNSVAYMDIEFLDISLEKIRDSPQGLKGLKGTCHCDFSIFFLQSLNI